MNCAVNGQDSMDLALAFLESQRSVLGVDVFCKISPNWAKPLLESENVLFTVRFNAQPISIEDTVIFCADDEKPEKLNELLRSKPRLAVGVPWLIVGSETSLNNVHKVVKANIDRRLYFLNSDSGTLDEVYYANNEKITNKLGFIEFNNSTRLVWSNFREFESRRANLRGMQVKTYGALSTSPLSYYYPYVRRKAPYMKNRKGKLVADVSHEKHFGTLAEVVGVIGDDLNCTIVNLVRKDQFFGWPIIKNGTFVGMTGMFGDLLTGEVDTIVAPVELIVERVGTMRMSHPVGTMTFVLLVGENAGDEDKEFLVYLIPYRTNLWIALTLNIVIAAVVIQLIQMIFLKEVKWNIASITMEILGKFWNMFQSYLGASSRSKFWTYLPTGSILIFIIFFIGNLIFMSYKAALASELSLRRKTLPFDSPEGLYHSGYR